VTCFFYFAVKIPTLFHSALADWLHHFTWW